MSRTEPSVTDNESCLDNNGLSSSVTTDGKSLHYQLYPPSVTDDGKGLCCPQCHQLFSSSVTVAFRTGSYSKLLCEPCAKEIDIPWRVCPLRHPGLCQQVICPLRRHRLIPIHYRLQFSLQQSRAPQATQRSPRLVPDRTGLSSLRSAIRTFTSGREDL